MPGTTAWSVRRCLPGRARRCWCWKRTSRWAALLYQLQPEVRKELGLSPKLASDDLDTIALAGDGKHIRLTSDSVSGVSDDDNEQYRRFLMHYVEIARETGVAGRHAAHAQTAD